MILPRLAAVSGSDTLPHGRELAAPSFPGAFPSHDRISTVHIFAHPLGRQVGARHARRARGRGPSLMPAVGEGVRITRQRRRWTWTFFSAVLIAVGALLAPVAILADSARVQLQSTDAFAATFAPLAHDPEVQTYLADQTTRVILKKVDVDPDHRAARDQDHRHEVHALEGLRHHLRQDPPGHPSSDGRDADGVRRCRALDHRRLPGHPARAHRRRGQNLHAGTGHRSRGGHPPRPPDGGARAGVQAHPVADGLRRHRGGRNLVADRRLPPPDRRGAARETAPDRSDLGGSRRRGHLAARRDRPRPGRGLRPAGGRRERAAAGCRHRGRRPGHRLPPQLGGHRGARRRARGARRLVRTRERRPRATARPGRRRRGHGPLRGRDARADDGRVRDPAALGAPRHPVSHRPGGRADRPARAAADGGHDPESTALASLLALLLVELLQRPPASGSPQSLAETTSSAR